MEVVDSAKLYFGQPLTLNKENNMIVYQPKVSDIVAMGEENFNSLVFPYLLTMDSILGILDKDSDESLQKYNIFDLFFIEIEDGKTIIDLILKENAIEVLINSLRYFLRVDDFQVLKNRHKIVINNSYLFDEIEFNKLREIIKAISVRDDIEVERPPKNMTPRQKDIYEKLKRGRRRNAEKNMVYIQDIANYTSFGGGFYISNKEIYDMTYYQLSNAYKSIVGKDTFNVNLAYKLSPKYEVKDNFKHWLDVLKVGKYDPTKQKY